jgi:hypothetical protein
MTKSRAKRQLFCLTVSFFANICPPLPFFSDTMIEELNRTISAA